MLKILRYDRAQATNYAIKYAKQRNPSYFDYTNFGGNCTNYVSQCLFAGAPVMNYSPNGWFYSSPESTSYSWANVEPLYNFLMSNKGVGVFGSNSPLDMCEVGDVIQLKFKHKNIFSHCLFVSKVNHASANGIYVCANTRDVLNVPLSSFMYKEMRLIHILGYRKYDL